MQCAHSPSSSTVCQARIIGYRRAKSHGGERSKSYCEGKVQELCDAKSVNVTWVTTWDKKVFRMRHLPQVASFELTMRQSPLTSQLGQPLLQEAFAHRDTVPRTPLPSQAKSPSGSQESSGCPQWAGTDVEEMIQYGGRGHELTL